MSRTPRTTPKAPDLRLYLITLNSHRFPNFGEQAVAYAYKVGFTGTHVVFYGPDGHPTGALVASAVLEMHVAVDPTTKEPMLFTADEALEDTMRFLETEEKIDD